MELQHFSHNHPLVFIEEPSHESEKAYYCSGCGEVISGPRFSCVTCGFHLDKNCAKAPSEINHPFHRNHSLNLLASSPYEKGSNFCNFCYKDCEKFVYHCSCDLDLHIKCALFLYNIAEKNFGDQLQYIAHKDPSISTENHSEELKKAKCFACWKPLLNSAYLSLDCGFYLHKKCIELPLEINHSFHLEHPLILQIISDPATCQICQKTQTRGLVYCCSICNFTLHVKCPRRSAQINHPYHLNHPFILQPNHKSLPCESCRKTTSWESTVYCCSICKFAFHIECISPPTVIEDKGHKHPFTLCWRQLPFNCDACGTRGNCLSYICLMCGFIVHKSCISLPPLLDLPRHDHRIYHTYFLVEDEFKMRKCRICNVVVNPRYGSYCCRSCTYICHVDCAIKDYNWYEFYEPKTLTIEQSLDSIISIKEDGTEISHFSHQHKLVLSDDNEDGKLCDGCILFISAPYYHCSQCNFLLHKSCAELPRKKKLWFHKHQTPQTLITDCIFKCGVCEFECSGFAYKCDNHGCPYTCLRCALVDSNTSRGHEHPLCFLEGKEAECKACGEKSKAEYWCNDCNFVVHDKCLKLPQIAQHSCDEHPLKLTYHEDNDYVQSHFCDICEKSRNPNHWFYHCAVCDTSSHPKCVLGSYPFIKLGSRYNEGDHPHKPLIFVQKDYSECHKCRKPCLDLALECAETGCKYIVHWKCITPFNPSLINFFHRGRRRSSW